MLQDLYIYLKTLDTRVEMGKMMSSPGITYKGKVFLFEYKDKIVFKLGKGFDISSYGIESFEYLNPFKKKGPMLAWYVVEDKYKSTFEDLSKVALDHMKDTIK